MKHETETVAGSGGSRKGDFTMGKNDGLLAAIRQIEQAERTRALVSVLGATDAARYVRGVVHAPTYAELADLFRPEAQ